jgi:hypothetical protein
VDYKLKRIDASLLPELIPIFKSAFGQFPEVNELLQKHFTDFTGQRNIGYLACTTNDEAIAFYGVFPLIVRIGGQSFLAAQSGDTMVDKRHEKRGLFTMLANETYKLCRDNKIAGVFGFPSPSSYPGFVKKLQWLHHENINRYQFLIPTIPLSEICFRNSVFKKWILKWHLILIGFLSEGVPFEGTILSVGSDGVCRSTDYWKYKLQKESIKLIKLQGCDVVIKSDGSLGVGDINYRTLTDLRRVVFCLKILCFFGGINRIVFYISPNTKLDRDLARISKAKKGLPIGFISFNEGMDMSKLKFCYLDMDTF